MHAYHFKLFKIRFIISKYIVLTLILGILGALLFWLVEWKWLRIITAKSSALLLVAMGYHVENCGDYLFIGQEKFQIVDACTGIAWLLIVTPFVASYSNYFIMNGLATLLLIVVWFPVNVLRICMAISLFCHGYSWKFSDTYPCLILCNLSMGIFILFWFKKRIRLRKE